MVRSQSLWVNEKWKVVRILLADTVSSWLWFLSPKSYWTNDVVLYTLFLQDAHCQTASPGMTARTGNVLCGSKLVTCELRTI